MYSCYTVEIVESIFLHQNIIGSRVFSYFLKESTNFFSIFKIVNRLLSYFSEQSCCRTPCAH